jgi:hypothetical protein
MALVDPNIALSYRGLQLQDPLDQYSKASAAQLNALQMDKFMRDRDALKQIQTAITAKGGPPDLESAANEMIRSGIPEYMTQGIAIRQKVQETKAWEDYQKRFLAPKTQVSEESAAPTTPPARVTPNPFQANMLDNRQNLPLNRLMPSVEAATAPAPQVSKAPVVSSQQQRLADLEEEIAMLSGIDTPKAKARQQVLLRQLEAALKPEANRPIPLSPGQVLYSPTGQKIATAPEKPEKPPTPTEIQRLMNERDALPAGDPRIEIYNRAIAKASTHSPATTVNLPPQEKAEQSDRGKLLVKQYEGISEAARIGARSLPALQSNIAILDKGFETGFGTEAKAAGAKVLAALGVKDAEKYATNAQTFLGNASAAILQRQLEQKGPQTEADAQRITQTGAQLGNTKEANKFLINVAKAQINRDIDQRNFYDKWWKTNKTYDGAEDAWYAGEGGKSLFERPELKSSVQAPSIVNQIPTGRAPTPAVARPPATKPAAASTPIPQAAIDALKAKKGTPEQFDEIFGAGAAKRVLGGK